MDETCSESKIHLAILKFEIRKIIPSLLGLILGSTSHFLIYNSNNSRNSFSGEYF